MAARKRLFDEVDNFDSIDKPVSSANIHGIVTSLSPVTKGRKSVYFDGTVSDGASNIRLVGFNSKQQKRMEDFMSKRQPVQLTDCEIKQARRGNKMEILLKANTTIGESPKKIEVLSVEFKDHTPSLVTLHELQGVDTYERVTVDVKVTRVSEVETVGTGKKKQDVTIADGGGTAKVTLWEEHIGELRNNICYNLANFVVREWGGRKYLSIARDSTISCIGDIGDVNEGDENEEIHELKNVQIVAVSQLDKYKACMRCKARVEPSSMEGFARCSKPECTMLQKFEFCTAQIAVKLLFMANGKIYSLSAYGKIVQDLAGVADYAQVTDEILLLLPMLKSITYNDANMVTNFSK